MSTQVKLVFCKDVASIDDFKRHLRWYVVDYELKSDLKIPENFEVLACQAAAEGKSLASKLRFGDSILTWSAKDEVRNAIQSYVSENEGLAKGWLFYAPHNFALKVFDRYLKTKNDDCIVCISNVEDLKSL